MHALNNISCINILDIQMIRLLKKLPSRQENRTSSRHYKRKEVVETILALEYDIQTTVTIDR